MADQSPDKAAVPEGEPSVPSTRRTSDGSVGNSMSNSQHLSASGTSQSRQPPKKTAPLQRVEGYGSVSSSPTDTRHSGPSATQPSSSRPKKPGLGRRTTSTAAPHRGQEFSVDDNPDEVQVDLAQQPGAKRPQQARMATGSLRRQPSTLRRRPTAQAPNLPRVESQESEELAAQEADRRSQTDGEVQPVSSGDDTLQADGEDENPGDEGDDDDDLSDTESFTLRDRQEAINETHPFGIRIWKPALYKKNRGIEKAAEGDIHSSPGGRVSHWLFLFNILWTVVFGWWLALIAAFGGLICIVLSVAGPGSLDYGMVLWDLAGYLLYPFGKYVKLIQEEAYAEEDEGEGRSISEYEQWQNGDIEEGRLFFGPVRSLIGHRRDSVDSTDETQSLLGRTGRSERRNTQGGKTKRRLFGRGEWNVGRVIFFIVFYGLLTPLLLLVSAICWFLVYTIPMGRVTYLIFDHLRRHPLALSFHNDSADTRRPGESSSILLCTYRAVGSKYWKYTIDGTNIFLFNLLVVVAFVIFDYWVLDVALGMEGGIANPGLVFTLALFSIIPLAYFIGQAVASISAQSSMGVGATINAFFSTVVEVFLYCVALNEGKAQLVEGSIIGSIFAGILFLPGLSMCFGALKRKTQRFNVRSAGVTSTMLLFAVIGCFGPTLFYQIYGSHELNCRQCVLNERAEDRDCRRCYFSQTPAVHDRFYIEAVRPYIWFAAVLLFLSYVIGLLFTLRTHAAVIWNNEPDEKKAEKIDLGGSHLTHMDGNVIGSNHADGSPHMQRVALQRNDTAGSTVGSQNIRDSQLYKRILGQSLKQVGLSPTGIELPKPSESRAVSQGSDSQTPHVVPPLSTSPQDNRSMHNVQLAGVASEDNNTLVRQVAEMAATAAAVAARDATKAPRKAHEMARRVSATPIPHAPRAGTFSDADMQDLQEAAQEGQAAGGHDAPNWSRTKSAVILLTATIAYAVIAEILVNTVDTVLDNVDIDEKFLGITLFALVPNTTEFLNAISFAMNGNIALSMEIGSAYALQVCLLQVPALVLFSAIHGRFIDPQDIIDHTFTLIFPQWDMVTVILCVFLLSYMYGEGKSNYFKGSILILSYFVVVVGFYFSGFNSMEMMGVDRFDTLSVKGEFETFRTIGRTRSGRAY